ncbi:DgyrCDS2996 [Dimorphilus gyrociliatus]|uniref:DgyrCDS2996 n=1 Tax=Dimorphilus gyrociliatus TaxID=2664684 RepID=A0A7I8VDN5_9ANNE|nr:DgyrCDS2996 [Dimorphilus gyrociliatus]
MAHRDVDTIIKDEILIEKLKKRGFNKCSDVLSSPNAVHLANYIDCSLSTADEIIKKISEKCRPPVVKVLDLLKTENDYLSTSLEKVDHLIKGLKIGSLTEISGPAGCGKTQFCMTISVAVAKADPDCSVYYIDTEGAVNCYRLLEIAENRTNENSELAKKILSHIIIVKESSVESLQERIDHLEEEIIERNVRLLIIDSVASPIRKEDDTRYGILMKLASTLKSIAESLRIAVSGAH